MQRLELVPHVLLGAAGDLAPDPLPVRPEAERDGTDVPVLRRVEVDRVFAAACAGMAVVARAEPKSRTEAVISRILTRFVIVDLRINAPVVSSITHAATGDICLHRRRVDGNR